MKLLAFSILYLILSIIGVVLSVSAPTDALPSFDVAIVTLVICGMVLNIVSLLVGVYKSEAYREYLINKKNEEII